MYILPSLKMFEIWSFWKKLKIFGDFSESQCKVYIFGQIIKKIFSSMWSRFLTKIRKRCLFSWAFRICDQNLHRYLRIFLDLRLNLKSGTFWRKFAPEASSAAQHPGLKKKKKKKKWLADDLPSCGLLSTMTWLLTCAHWCRLFGETGKSGNFGSFLYKQTCTYVFWF